MFVPPKPLFSIKNSDVRKYLLFYSVFVPVFPVSASSNLEQTSLEHRSHSESWTMRGCMLVKQAASALGYRHNSNQSSLRHLPILALCGLLLAYSPGIQAEQQPEYRLKVAFLYNFIAYTEWPDQQNLNLNFCIYGEDPFGEHLQHLWSKKTNEQEILIRHTHNIEDLSMYQIVFIPRSVMHDLNAILNQLNGKPILTISDSPNASLQDVVINMPLKEGKVTFEANIASAKRNGLKLSSQLLRFASEVYQ